LRCLKDHDVSGGFRNGPSANLSLVIQQVGVFSPTPLPARRMKGCEAKKCNAGHLPSLRLDLAWARRHSNWLGKLHHFPAEFGQTLFFCLVAVARCLAGDGWECHAGVSALSQLLGLSWGEKSGEKVTPLRAGCPPQGTRIRAYRDGGVERLGEEEIG